MTQDREEASPEKTTGSMRYVKMFVSECLEGTIRFDFDPSERGVWYDLVILSGRMRVKGLICARPGTPYPHSWIAGVLNVPLDLLDRTLAKCEKTQRIEEGDDGIRILNWHKYQSEYERQRPYREAKKKETTTGKDKGHSFEKCSKCGQITTSCVCEGSPLWRKLNKDKAQEKLDNV